MYKAASTLFLAALAVSASPVQSERVKRWTQSQANCRSFYADIYAQAENIDLENVLGPIPSSQQVLVESSIEQFAAGSTVQAQIAAAHNTSVSGTYSLYFEYCEPKTGTPAGIFQTHHGLVGNAAYWNVHLDNKTDNSFAESAAAAGWSTLSYDRLGVGNSSHPNGLTTVQINYEIAQSIGIAEALRNGYLSDLGKWSKVVGVGHSYGSNLLTGVAAINPGVFDALILTGFTNNATQGPLGLAGFSSTIASVAYPNRFSSLGNDYVITPSVSADQLGFFHYPNYTQSALELFTTTKSEYSLGQQNSIAAPLKLTRPNYTNPTLVVTGANDAPYCAADCSVTSLGGNMTQLDTARTLYPGVPDSAFETFVVPATGHGINYHETAYAAYQEIIAFIKRQNV